MTGLRRAATAAVAWNAAQQGGGDVVQFVLLLALARLLDARDFGETALASAILAPVALIAGQGMTAALVLLKEIEARHVATAFYTTVLSSAALASITILLAPWLTDVFSASRLMQLLPPLALALVVAAAGSVAQAVERRSLEFRRIAVAMLVARCVAGSAALATALAGGGVWSLVIRQLVEALVTALWLWGRHWRELAARPSFGCWRDLSRRGNGVALVNIIPILQLRGGELLISHMMGPTILGQYVLARRIIDGVTGFGPALLLNMSWAIFPRMQGEPLRLRQAMRSVLEVLGAASPPLLLLVGGTAPFWTPLVLGPRWAEIIPLTQGIAAGSLGRFLLGFNLIVMIASGGSVQRRLGIEAALAVGSLAILYLGLQRGDLGLAWASAVAPSLLAGPCLMLIGKHVPLDVQAQLKVLGPPLLAAFGALVAFRLTDVLLPAATSVAATAVSLCAYVIVFHGAAPSFLPRLVRSGLADLAALRQK